jgi:hypothetical protein
MRHKSYSFSFLEREERKSESWEWQSSHKRGDDWSEMSKFSGRLISKENFDEKSEKRNPNEDLRTRREWLLYYSMRRDLWSDTKRTFSSVNPWQENREDPLLRLFSLYLSFVYDSMYNTRELLRQMSSSIKSWCNFSPFLSRRLRTWSSNVSSFAYSFSSCRSIFV